RRRQAAVRPRGRRRAPRVREEAGSFATARLAGRSVSCLRDRRRRRNRRSRGRRAGNVGRTSGSGALGIQLRIAPRGHGALLDLAKLEGGADSLDLQDVSVEGLFGRVAARHAPQAAAKALSVSTTIAPGAEIVYGDRFRLEQALQNLAANAIRHAPDGGGVNLGADVRGGGIALTVADNGPGIAPAHVAFVFDRFYKADSARSGDSSGSGLGLSIVRAIVERHGGSVNVSNEPGAATVFTIWLPPPDLTASR